MNLLKNKLFKKILSKFRILKKYLITLVNETKYTKHIVGLENHGKNCKIANPLACVVTNIINSEERAHHVAVV